MNPGKGTPKSLWKLVLLALFAGPFVLTTICSGQDKGKTREQKSESKPTATAPASQHHSASTPRPGNTEGRPANVQPHANPNQQHPVNTLPHPTGIEQHPVGTERQHAPNMPQRGPGSAAQEPANISSRPDKSPGSASGRGATTEQHPMTAQPHPVTTEQHPVNTERQRPATIADRRDEAGSKGSGAGNPASGRVKWPGAGSTARAGVAPAGVERHEDRSRTVTRRDGSHIDYGRTGKPDRVSLSNGTNARFDSRGRVSSLHAHDMTINRGVHGERRIETRRVDVRGDRYRVVSVGAHRGFVEHPFLHEGRSYMRRTYVMDGHVYARVYGRHYYHGWGYYRYVPAYRWGPRFYVWAYNPWARPVYWHWGWAPAPWWGCYGCYFAPYPYYAAPAFWLTDYILAANLQAAYEAGRASSAQEQESANIPPEYQSQPPDTGSANPVTLTPEVKQAIADEVKAQLAAEQQTGADSQPTASPTSDEVPEALDPNQRTFIVSSALNAETPDGSECSLGAGDVLTRIDDAPDADQKVKVLVSASQKGDCRAGTQFAIAVEDLQDMRNDFRQQIDQGLKQLAESQGKNGVPQAPDAVARPVPVGQAQPDATAKADLDNQQQDANRAEADVQQAAGPDQQN